MATLQRHQRRLSRFSVVVSALLATATASTSIHAEDLVEYRAGVTLGFGYNALTGEFTGPCFTGTTKPTFYESPRGTFLWEEAESLEDVRRKLNISVSAAYKGLGSSAQGRVSYLRNYNTSASNITIVARNRIETGFDALEDIRLTDYVRGKVEVDGKQDLLALREQCGTHYVQAIIAGGELYATLSQTVRSEAESSEFSVAVSGSGSGYSGSANTSTALEQSRFDKTVKIQGSYAGGNGPNPTTPTDLKLQFQQLREQVRKVAADEASTKQRKASPIDVALVKITRSGLDAQKLDALEVALGKEEALHTYAANVRAISASPSSYNLDPVNLHQTTQIIDQKVSAAIGSMRSQMRRCSEADEATVATACDFSRYPIAPGVHDSGLPSLYQEACLSPWQPPNYTTQFEGIPHTRHDASMGGGDTILIDTRYEGSQASGLTQTTRLFVYESTHYTQFDKTLTRSFFNAASAPAPACYLADPVNLTQVPGRVNVGNHHNVYHAITFDTDLVVDATCRTNQGGGDIGYVGCNRIAFKPIRLELEHIEKLIGPPAVQLRIPEWLTVAAAIQ